VAVTSPKTAIMDEDISIYFCKALGFTSIEIDG